MAWYLHQVLQAWSTPDFTFDNKPASFIKAVVPVYGFGFWWDPENVPRTARRTKKKRIPDVFQTAGRCVASQRFKDLLEEFEPGVHQFFPLTLIDHDGSKVQPDYYIFNCTVAVDSILLKESGLD
ncbi:imm11 family protein [Polycladidibacter hongkongensis]|uniref:imm11 family protein n=1 Tax=Polycladidibacter hongkongensis TaxID=1647556 RepID=UPI00082A8BC1|nr:DUF1629 domain-containing protein [Pseudovibrio hongkongensis]